MIVVRDGKSEVHMLCKFSKCTETEGWECSVTGKTMEHPCDDTLGVPDVHCYAPLEHLFIPMPKSGWVCHACTRQRVKVGSTMTEWCKDCNPPKEVQ